LFLDRNAITSALVTIIKATSGNGLCSALTLTPCHPRDWRLTKIC
jgi:hypothetical protein